MEAEAAAAKIKKVDNERAIHCKHFTQTEYGNIKNYDLCIESDDFGVAETAQIISDLFKKRFLKKVRMSKHPNLFYHGLQILHGSYPSAIISSREAVYSFLLVSLIFAAELQLERWNFFVFVLRI